MQAAIGTLFYKKTKLNFAQYLRTNYEQSQLRQQNKVSKFQIKNKYLLLKYTFFIRTIL